MNRMKFVLVTVFSLFFAVNSAMAAGITAAKTPAGTTAKAPAPDTATPGKEVEASDRVVLVDDFDRGEQPNNLGGISQGKEEFPGGCIPAFVNDPKVTFGGSGYSMKLEFEVTPPGAFSYYVTNMGPQGDVAGSTVPLDLTGYQYFSFWMRPDTSKPEFVIDIHEDRDGDGFFVQGKDGVSRVDIKRFIEVGKRNQWQKVTLPFKAFKKIQNWSRVLEVAFVFENKKDKQGQEQKGIVYIDDIVFGTTNPDDETPEAAGELNVGAKLTADGVNTAGKEIPVAAKCKLELLLSGSSPILERVHIDASTDGGQTWKVVKNFYGYESGKSLVYEWTPPFSKPTPVIFRIGGTSILGRDVVLGS